MTRGNCTKGGKPQKRARYQASLYLEIRLSGFCQARLRLQGLLTNAPASLAHQTLSYRLQLNEIDKKGGKVCLTLILSIAHYQMGH